MKLLAAALVVTLASSSWAAQRSAKAVAEFRRANPCPATGKARGACPGWQVDHRHPLCAAGADKPENLQWLSVEDHKAKTRLDHALCRTKWRDR